jgi:methionine-rich copper-binding protein CopC
MPASFRCSLAIAANPDDLLDCGPQAINPEKLAMAHNVRMTRSRTSTRGLALTLFLVMFTGATPIWAKPMTVIDSFPMVNQIMEGAATSFSIRFDGPVAHGSARLTLVTPGGKRSLHARLGSEPNTLFTAVGALPPGAYEVRWEVRAMDGQRSTGAIPFKVSSP